MKFPKFSKNQWIGISGTLAVLIVGFVTPYFQQQNPTQTVDHSPGSINTVGQTGGVNVITDTQSKLQIEYFDDAKLDVFGLPFHGTPNQITISTSLSKYLSPFLSQPDSTPFLWKCSEDAVNAYGKIISVYPKFPFAYFYLGDCKKRLGIKGWEFSIDGARRILEITTTISGHHSNHDEVLKLITENY